MEFSLAGLLIERDQSRLNFVQSGETLIALEPTRGPGMLDRLPVVFRSAMYALRGGFLIRPLAIAVVFGAMGAVLSSLEESTPEISAWIPHTLFPSHEDPGVAQMILSSVATSIMTVVSIVFAILLMTLTLASHYPDRRYCATRHVSWDQ